MKASLVFPFVFLVVCVVYGQQQRSDCYVDCAVDIQCESGCGPVWDDSDGCCRFCCETECVDCFQDPCTSYSCKDNPNWTCQANYCGGCNREWYDADGAYYICSEEILVSSEEEWNTECNTNGDCSLQNRENDFSCCFAGSCDSIDYAEEKWEPVNQEWWFECHEACSVDCGPAPLCPDIQPEGTEWEAHCINQVCAKVDTDEDSSPFTTVDSFTSLSSVSTDDTSDSFVFSQSLSNSDDDNSSFSPPDSNSTENDESNDDDSGNSSAAPCAHSLPLGMLVLLYLFI
uniref:Uncharacterized protein n=1 Tax=Vannella robusta TaxID=1487602 RepID=A0A7S4M6N3_9EUKA|mmetsp:Transcript_13405/g.16877  ORF Transcript_13405/g.16877 Transcript_13405/m.16877 type:complete len:287 (+) Transcript_13405:114-974(+)